MAAILRLEIVGPVVLALRLARLCSHVSRIVRDRAPLSFQRVRLLDHGFLLAFARASVRIAILRGLGGISGVDCHLLLVAVRVEMRCRTF